MGGNQSQPSDTVRPADAEVLPAQGSMDERAAGRRWRPLIWTGVILGLVGLVAAILSRRWGRRPVETRPSVPPELPPGLTEEEAAGRWSEGMDNAVYLKPPRTRQQIVRENALTIFNLNLVGLAFTQALLGQWLNALLSLGTIALNVGLNVAQELLAIRRLAEFQRSSRPKATVVREGKARSVDPGRVVVGDVLIIGPGDQFLVDGQVVGPGRMVVDESLVTGGRGWRTKRAGDQVYAGSFCISGRGACVARTVGDERAIVSRSAGASAPAEELTPLERTVSHILRVLLVLVGLLAALLLAAVFRLDLGVPVAILNDAASVIFNIAPAGLYLMIVVTYTTGTADLARLGALVHRARSVESLAQATVICFAEAGILAGTRIAMEPAQPAEDRDHPSESRLRQILGDYARSTSASDLVTRALANTFEGNRRTIREEAPFLSAYGWSGVAFDDRDLRGVYVLGEPAILQPNLAAQGEGREVTEGRSPATAVSRLVSPLGRMFRRRGKEAPNGGEQGTLARGPDPNDAQATAEPPAGPSREGEDVPEDGEVREPFFRRWARQVGRTVGRRERRPEQPETPEEQTGEEAVLLFAYRSESVPLHDAQGNVQLPEALIPLCELRYARRLRPEAIETVRAFARTGVGIKVFTSGDPEQTVAMFQQAWPGRDNGQLLREPSTVSGRDLEQLPADRWARTAEENTVFGHITPEQAGALVAALRAAGESVAVVGDGVTDLVALQQANLAIARQTSTQAALSVADIVLLGNSPEVLVRVLHKGQRIVHGLLDVLKLNLTQVSYLAILIFAMGLLSIGFPYRSAQGTAIAVITVAIPSVALTFWTAAGVVSGASFGRSLARFVVPAAVSMALAGLVVYRHLLGRTGELAYAQLGLTYTLILSGLLLPVFLRPPWRTAPGEEDGRKRDWRMAGLALVLGIASILLPAVPAAERYLELAWLHQPADYGVVGLAVLAWALLLSVIWRAIPGTGSAPRPRPHPE